MTNRSEEGSAAEPPPNDDDAQPFLVIGLGASAGGIKALQEFFTHVPARSGAAYVVILHLSPDHDSKLAEVLQSTASIPVMQVRERVSIQSDHVYVIPPNQSLAIEGGDLVLSGMTRIEQRRSPVDIFFRTLADARGSRAVVVVLSGTGANGSIGLERVKQHGGLVIAQDPDESEYSDMPNNSIATGLVDYILPVGEIPGRIFDHKDRLQRGQGDVPPATRIENDADALREVLMLLRVRTGQDFSNYKPATVLRRVERRVSLRNITTLADYAQFMRGHPDEAAALMKELLISVTNFFRDPNAFAALELRVIPRLFATKQAHDQVRVWVAGCATGEEAYSIAMLLVEHAETVLERPNIQVFATDLDEQAIATAREGLYTDAEVADVSEERLRRFFQSEPGGYRVRRDLRELLLFAHHNVIRDPPFSHLDLIACRNVMIYLNRSIQERLIQTFHFALEPGGVLFLGASESSESTDELFLPIDKAAHLYETRSLASRVALPLADAVVPVPPRSAHRRGEGGQSERIAPAELHQRLLEQYAPPSVVVTEDYALVHISERAGQFLQVTGGEPSRDVLQLVRPEMRIDLRSALHQAARQRSNVEVRGIRVTSLADALIKIIVRPVLRDGEPSRGYFLILFEQDRGEPLPSEPALRLTSPVETATSQLEEDLTDVKAQLRATIEQYETQAEEAKASNEELQAMNEELRAAAEELETSKEELQSVNEELTTVNQELKIKIDELGLTNNDFRNFINATDVGTIFLDRMLRVKFVTSRARDIFNLLPTDTGRQLSDITSKLIYNDLHDDIRQVLERLQTIEREVQTREGRRHLIRILPYRTSDDRIDGIVITSQDTTSLRDADLRVRASEERLRLLIDSILDYAIFTMTNDGRVESWNAGAERMFGYTAEQIIGTQASALFTPEDRAAGVPEEELTRASRDGRAEDERWHVRRNGTRLYCSGVTTRLGDNGGLGFAKIARDLTERRRAEMALQDAHSELENRVQERTHELRSRVVQHAAAEEHVISLLRRLVSTQEQERARIARDLHDQLGQQLTALRLMLERYQQGRALETSADDGLAPALALAAEIDETVDFLAWELRPAALDDLGLAAALPRYVSEWSKHFDIAAEFRSGGGGSGQLSRDAEVAFYRVAQEALSNVLKHSHASRVDVLLEHRDDTVTLVVEDDGVGFDPSDQQTVDKGMGLVGMRERAALIGAVLQVESAPGKGSTVFLRCPVAGAHSPDGGST